MSLATERRDMLKIKAREAAYLTCLGAAKMAGALAGGGGEGDIVGSVLFLPAVRDSRRLADIANRIAWYLPAGESYSLDVEVAVERTLLNTQMATLVPPSPQRGYLDGNPRITLVDQVDLDAARFDAVMVWHSRALLSPRLVKRLHAVSIVDPLFYSAVEAANFRSLFARTLASDTREELLELSLAHYQALIERVSHCDRAFVFGTGPSLEQAEAFDFGGAFNVVCNSIVKNKGLLRHIKPQLLVFGDPVFHFSPCRYSAEFRDAVIETVEEHDCYVAVQDVSLPLLLAHYPKLESRLMGIPVHPDPFNFPNADRFYVRAAQNVMTRCMLPVASAIADEIYVLGADGRRPDEKYFWTHSSSAQFDDLMQTAVDTHPSFFRDTVYTDYYDKHCRTLESLFRYGEAMGKRYYSLTPSYIPALARRPAPGRLQ